MRTCTKNPDKIRISGFGVKNKPKIRICQSGTDMQTLGVREYSRKINLAEECSPAYDGDTGELLQVNQTN